MDPQISLVIMVVLLTAVLIWLGVITVMFLKMQRQRREVAESVTQGNLDELISKSVRDIASLGQQINSLEEKHSNTVQHVQGVIQRVGVVRYDAFGDIGGQLSYSVALLNQHGDGVVLTALNGRQESRSYAKSVEKGASKYDLSKEEKQAITKALS